MAETDYYLKVDGIEGESTREGKEKQIEVTSWSFGATQAGTAAGTGGAGAGKVSIHDFNFTMENSTAASKLFNATTSGKHIKSAILSCRKAGGKQEDYMIVTFTDVLISSFQQGGGGSGIVPVVSITFNAVKIEVEIKEQKPDGSMGAGVKASYDLKLAKST
jgi:type VI secretion system secreted protein Hcp